MIWEWFNFHLVETAIEAAEFSDLQISEIIEALEGFAKNPELAQTEKLELPGRPTTYLLDLPHRGILAFRLFPDGFPPKNHPAISVRVVS